MDECNECTEVQVVAPAKRGRRPKVVVEQAIDGGDDGPNVPNGPNVLNVPTKKVAAKRVTSKSKAVYDVAAEALPKDVPEEDTVIIKLDVHLNSEPKPKSKSKPSVQREDPFAFAYDTHTYDAFDTMYSPDMFGVHPGGGAVDQDHPSHPSHPSHCPSHMGMQMQMQGMQGMQGGGMYLDQGMDQAHHSHHSQHAHQQQGPGRGMYVNQGLNQGMYANRGQPSLPELQQDDDLQIEQADAEGEVTNVQPVQSMKAIRLLMDFDEKCKNGEWPASTSVHCYWCCHRFQNVPIGIPLTYNEDIAKFMVYGCFCSCECAAAYNLDSKESSDEIMTRHGFLNMLARELGHRELVRPAPSRLVLSMFGGPMSIEHFRERCHTSRLILVNFPPMMTVTQQVEEINQRDMRSEYRYIPLDSERVNKYKEKIKLKRSKPLVNYKNTLDHTMNLKFA